MPEWRVSIDAAPGHELDADGLERVAHVLNCDFPHLAPACALHEGRLGITVSVEGDEQEALEGAVMAWHAAGVTAGIGVWPVIAHVEIDAVNEDARAVA